MYSNAIKRIGILLFYHIALSAQAIAQDLPQEKNKNADVLMGNLTTQTSFNALPDQCVTLREGRDCYAEVTIHWQSEHKQSLCLYQEGVEQHLGCWHDNNDARIAIEFISNENLNYQLRSVHNNEVIAETEVAVRWVHKGSSRKRRWRLF